MQICTNVENRLIISATPNQAQHLPQFVRIYFVCFYGCGYLFSAPQPPQLTT